MTFSHRAEDFDSYDIIFLAMDRELRVAGTGKTDVRITRRVICSPVAKEDLDTTAKSKSKVAFTGSCFVVISRLFPFNSLLLILFRHHLQVCLCFVPFY